MDAQNLKRAMEKADSEILDIFTVRPQCGVRVSKEDYQDALHAIQNNTTQPNQSVE